MTEIKNVPENELFVDYYENSGILYLQKAKSKKDDMGVPTEWISGKSVPIEP